MHQERGALGPQPQEKDASRTMHHERGVPGLLQQGRGAPDPQRVRRDASCPLAHILREVGE